MSDAGESSHRRSKSAAALAILRGKKDKGDDDSSSEEGVPTGLPASTATQTTGSRHSSKLSTSVPNMARTPSSQNSPPKMAASSVASPPPAASLSDKPVSLEQSLRKFKIVEALRSGDTASIMRAIRDTAEGGPRNSTSSLGTPSGGPLEDTTILHLAIQCAEFAVVEYVLSNGAGYLDINARDKDGNTPLHIASGQGRAPVLRLLLEQKDINDAIANHHGRLPIDVARNADIFQQLQLARSLFTEAKVKQIQELIQREDYGTLKDVLEEPRAKAVLDINSPDFASESTTVASGGTLLHEAARQRNTKLIQILLLHGADPFRRDRKGKLPQDVTKDDTTRAMLKKSPAAVAAQRGIQEKAVLGNLASQGAASSSPMDPLAGREGREMKGYLKKWTNYRKGYQLRWFVLEDGVLSYYKHQDDAGSACRGAINMRIAKLHMSADEKTKFEIIGKSSVKYTLKANHEVEAKRWFWALNNSIQWTKDQAKEEERQKAKDAELLRQAKDQGGLLASAENLSLAETRTSNQISRTHSSSRYSTQKGELAGTSTAGSGDLEDDDKQDVATDAGQSRVPGGPVIPGDYDEDEDDEDDDELSQRGAPAVTKDAFNITAQSARLQLDTIAAVNASLMSEATKNPTAQLGDAQVSQALATYDGAIRTLTELVGNLLKISKDRDSYWQYRLDREVQVRRMWEESMAKVAKEQEQLEAKYGAAEMKRRLTKKALKEVMVHGGAEAVSEEVEEVEEVEEAPTKGVTRRKTALEKIQQMSDIESSEDEEFFDAVDAGEVEFTELPPAEAPAEEAVVVSGELDISSSFKGYENGIRTRLKIDADNRPKVSLWGILKSMIGKDMTKMTLPVTFNEPTSLLYRCGEDMEYADLLDLAADRTDSIERLMYVAAFAASEYASTIGRIAKPFNPLLGETFEYVRPDKNYRFFIEQVSHHPPIGAAWAESPKWTYYGESAVKSKFYGKSFDINPLGTWFLKLRPTAGGKEDFYTWKKVTSSVIGIITGAPTVDNYGLMEITNWSTGEKCLLDFKPRGWTNASAYQIAGKILDRQGRVVVSLGGRWNSKLYARLTPGYEATPDEPADGVPLHRGSLSQSDPKTAFLIWKANPRPTGIPFNLTPFVLTFNHIDDKLRPWLAPTDSRLRPDQRAMEEGQYDLAATEKNRLEEAQRARRRMREEKGLEFKPAWFTKERCEITGEEYWQFNGQYWLQREKAGSGDGTAWEGLEPIFENAPPNNSGGGMMRRTTTTMSK